MAKPLHLVPFGKAHVAEVAAIEADAHASPWSEASIRRELTNPDGVFLVGMEGTEVAGYAAAWVVVDEAHVVNVGVRAASRGRGHGKRLLGELLSRCRDRGATCATLEVRASNDAALALYRGLGFVDCGRRKRYYPGGEDAVVMWLHELEP